MGAAVADPARFACFRWAYENQAADDHTRPFSIFAAGFDKVTSEAKHQQARADSPLFNGGRVLSSLVSRRIPKLTGATMAFPPPSYIDPGPL
jgi:hypothetical protein